MHVYSNINQPKTQSMIPLHIIISEKITATNHLSRHLNPLSQMSLVNERRMKQGSGLSSRKNDQLNDLR